MKKVLDATCGGRMMWFDKQNPIAHFVDNRHVEPEIVGSGRSARKFSVEPDELVDFTNMPFDDDTYYLTVFDPPHLKNNAGDKSYMARKYGKLPKEWQDYLRRGFEECWRVTKPNGTIIVKWNETQIPTSRLIEALGRRPLFGHTTNLRGTTKWLVYIKADPQ